MLNAYLPSFVPLALDFSTYYNPKTGVIALYINNFLIFAKTNQFPEKPGFQESEAIATP